MAKKMRKQHGGCGDICFGGGKENKNFKLKFRISSKQKSRLITFGSKEKIIVGLIAVVFIFTSALKHSISNKKPKKMNKKADKNESEEADENENKDDNEEGPIDKKTGLPHFIKRIIMPIDFN
tara:strand:- start:454 stop:822 length:369 start_codon:yes stop_codon:yes gene_type:complete